MFYAISWIAIASLLALWSLATWALQSVAVWGISNAGALSGAASGVGGIALPEWLVPWIPAEVVQAMSHLTEGLRPLVDSLLQSAPALAGGVTVTAWAVWGIGSVLLLLLGAGLHVLIAVWRRRGRGGPGVGRSMAAG